MLSPAYKAHNIVILFKFRIPGSYYFSHTISINHLNKSIRHSGGTRTSLSGGHHKTLFYRLQLESLKHVFY
ncbi:hypothetical protein HanXRQr2_Chr03g0090091 [Helianthus annuus]|uniref:Uncharacterized protein n=1 Tax=Helianthus annuus TaxID=4232 RepID=A0A9K3NU63_HELAN|nr:hypothetical protein HanXRQr2_Chr03g0090091 [Helianthus annuus]